MTNEKVDEVFRELATILEMSGHTPRRLDPGETMPGRMRALSHCLALCKVAADFGPERLHKKLKWLGFIQGVLWIYGLASVEGLERMNAEDMAVAEP